MAPHAARAGRPPARLLIATGAAVALALVPLAGAGAVRRGPDLKVTAVTPATDSLVPGAALSASVTTRNAGKRRARRSVIALYLSRDARKSRDDLRLGTARIKALGPRKSARKAIAATIAAPTRAGAYRVLACADDSRKLRETKEKNNCRAARGTLTVGAGPGGGDTGGGGADPVGGGGAGPIGGTASDPSGDDDDGDGSLNSADCAPNDPSIQPGAADEPDAPAFRDTNCDGIDGNEARAVFVSTAGNDANAGTRAQPKRSVQAGIGLADVDDRQVYVSSGTFAELLVVADSVGVYGGYDGSDWSRSSANVTRLTGVLAAGRSEGAVASSIASPTTLQLITLAPVSPVGVGASSYGLRATNSPGLVLDAMVVRAPAATPGSNGSDGADGPDGAVGQPGFAGSCNGPRGSGGPGGASPAGRPGGSGGDGAGQFEDTGLAKSGDPGTGGTQGGTAGATPGGNADGGDGGNGSPGNPGGRGGDGVGGGGGEIVNGLFAGAAGQPGTQGASGNGGGGGGGGGAQRGGDVDNGGGNGGGGGGGAGGGGQGAGLGSAGGGSFGVLVISSTGLTIRDSTILAGDGGNGGAGGTGGEGGIGFAGGPGASECTDQVGRGGNGGPGGGGGRGGHGGGGAGGPSFALYRANTAVTSSGNLLSAGNGGQGGVAPLNPGTPGQAAPQN